MISKHFSIFPRNYSFIRKLISFKSSVLGNDEKASRICSSSLPQLFHFLILAKNFFQLFRQPLNASEYNRFQKKINYFLSITDFMLNVTVIIANRETNTSSIRNSHVTINIFCRFAFVINYVHRVDICR